MIKYPILLALILTIVLVICGSASADQTVIPSCADSNLTVSNDEGARFDVYGNDSYNFFNSTSQSATQGQNALHITTNTSNPSGNVVFTTNQSGTFYFGDTGGRGWDDNCILMLAVNGTIPDNFWIHITSSGYQWTPVFYTEYPDISNLTYVIGAVNETFTKDDFLYGPQIWKPCPATNYPIFAGQNMDDTTNTFSMMFIDLWVGLLGSNSGLTNLLIDNGMVRIDYEIYNLPEGSLAAFNAYAYCQSSKQGNGIRWGNRIDSGYNIFGTNYPPVADFSANSTRGTVPLTVQFTDNSTGTKPISYAWDFNNDGIIDSTEQNPVFTYDNPGTYTVRLTVTNVAGSDEKTMIITTSNDDILAPTPSANLSDGYYNTDKTVVLSAVDDWDLDPKIYYTLDGTNPTTNSTLYTGPISINGEGTKILKFFAVDVAGNPSAPVTKTYIIDKTAPTATADPLGGTYNVVKSITLTATDSNPTTIYYTTDGSNPKSSGTRSVYTGPITINETTNLLFATLDAAGNWSPLYNITYTMVDIAAPVPSADLPSGSYNSDQIVKLAAIDELDFNPKIFYTLDGTNPTTNSTLYNWPIGINLVGTTILKFIAVDWAGHISDVYTRTYELDKPGASGTWNTTTLDTNIHYNSVAIDSSGNPHIAYYQKAGSGTDYPDLKYAYMDQTGWHIETLETTKSGSGYYVSLALDSLGYPHIAYSQSTPDKLKYAYKDASGWHFFEIFNNTDVSCINLALYQDLPRIVYFENTEERLKYMYYNGTDWFSEYVTPNATYGHWNSLALNSNGNPRVSYYQFDPSRNSGILMYAKRSPTGLWQIDTVDDSGDVGKWSSLATGSLGNPCISYSTMDGGLRYAYWSEAKWVIETVDNLKTEVNKMVLDLSGNPRIIYKDFITGNFKYVYREGSTWIKSNINTIDGVGEWISFTMSQSGIPSISYMSSHSQLMYANLVPFVISADPSGGSYELVQKVNLTSTSGTTIYYTIDGSDPRISSSKIRYNGPIPVNNTTTIKFAAVDSASNWSIVCTETYSITDVTGPTVAINPVGNTYATPRSVNLTTTDLNPSTTYYTTDGSDPRSSSTRSVYTGPIQIGNTMTLKFAAVDVVGNWGPVYTENYTILNGFTTSEVLEAAYYVKNYVDTYKKLPDHVTISDANVSMASFLEIITTAVLNIQNNDLNSILHLFNCVKGPFPLDQLQSGNMPQAEYLKIAGVIKSSMDKGGIAPEFYENISLGRFFGYENMIYTFSSILVSYNSNKTLPGNIPVKPWKIVTATSFTLNEVLTAADWVKNYVDTYKKLPDSVSIKGINVSMASFLELITTAVLNIQNNDLNSTLSLYNCVRGPVPQDNIRSGNMSKTEYLRIAGVLKSSMDVWGVAPEFYENISLGRFFGYENMVYTFSSILVSYNSNKTLPGNISVKPWKLVTATTFTLDQVLIAADWVKDYVDDNKKLPDTVKVGNINVSMASFLELITTAVLNIQNNDLNSTLSLYNCVKGPVPRDQLQSGNMSKTEYLRIAGVLKSSMDANGIAPEFYENISLGRFFGYENMVYTFSSILVSYNSNKTLPGNISVKPWKLVTATAFSINEVIQAAGYVKSYVDDNRKLPDTVKVGNINVSMASFLELLVTATLNIQNSDLNSVLALFSCVKGPVPQDNIRSGNMSKTEYLRIAGVLKSSLDTGGVAPEFYENISLGRFFGYENMVYTFSSILVSYNSNKTLPGNIPVKPWKQIIAISFTLNEVLTAANNVTNYVNINKKLPDYVTINGINVSMPSFLELITTATLNIKNNDLISTLSLYNCVKGPVPRDQLQSGNVPQAEYLKIAGVLKSSMDTGGVAPEFYENISLGRFFGYENMVYTFSNILSSYNITKILPSFIEVKPWATI